MILSSVITYARAAAQTNSDGLSDETALIFANEAVEDFHRRLVQKRVDASKIVESSITGTVNTGVYNYPSNPSCLGLKVLELNYSNTSPADYKVAEQVDVSNLPTGGFGWLRVNADPNNPKFDDRGDKFEIFPTPNSSHNVTAMMRMFYFAKPSILTAVSNTVDYPENQDIGILGNRIAANYKYSLQGVDNYAAGDQLNAKYEERVAQYIDTLGRGTQQPQQATALQIDGFQY